MIKIKYHTPEQREELLATYIEKGLSAIGEENIVEGNFLCFGEPSEMELLKQENEQLKKRLDEMDAALFDVIIKTSMTI